MDFKSTLIPYKDTNAFSALVLDYISGDKDLENFYAHPPTKEGILAAVNARKMHYTDRELLCDRLERQYEGKLISAKLRSNLDALSSENTFTITTAHQPNIFTGHLYFIYKILHAVKLADALSAELQDYNFVPVYYMGSEDADLEELGEVTINEKVHRWETKQTGAVGRMRIDDKFIKIISDIEGQLAVEPFGPAIIELVKSCYTKGATIEAATFNFTHELFNEYGLIILLPDDAGLKAAFFEIARKELQTNFSQHVVEKTTAEFPSKYKVQAAGRPINLFYLLDDKRERIEKAGDEFIVTNSNLKFTETELLSELKLHPERISPNVILRPLFQVLVLPDVAFIGGGGELAYWLELKALFETAGLPFPVLVLRNSFTIITRAAFRMLRKLGLEETGIFSSEQELVNRLVKRDSTIRLNFSEEKLAIIKLYKQIRVDAGKADVSLEPHVWALQSKAIQKIEQLEKKMLKAARKKADAQVRQVHKLRSKLFPSGNLQERVDNILPYYSAYGKSILDIIYDHSGGLDQHFCVLTDLGEA